MLTIRISFYQFHIWSDIKENKIHCNIDIFILMSRTIKAAERRREDNKMTALQRSRAQREEALLRRKQQFDETLARRQVRKKMILNISLV